MLLQQLAQLRQSVSAQTSLSICSEIVSKYLGGLFSVLVKKLLKDFDVFLTFFLNWRILMGSINQLKIRLAYSKIDKRNLSAKNTT
jgi:hypothetical protein